MACQPYEAPWQTVLLGYVVGAFVGIVLGSLETGYEDDEEEGANRPVPNWTVEPAAPTRVLRGVPELTIDGFPQGRRDSFKDVVGDLESCSVCLSTFFAETVVAQLPKCKHIFCPGCVKEWLLEHTDCPLCKTQVLAPQERRALAGIAERDPLEVRHVLFPDPVGVPTPPRPTPPEPGEVVVHIEASVPPEPEPAQDSTFSAGISLELAIHTEISDDAEDLELQP